MRLYFIAIALLIGPMLSAEPPNSSGDPDVAALIRDLGSPSAQCRAAATKALRVRGQQVAAAVEKAATQHADAEVRERAMEIHRDFQYGVYGDTPANVVAAIHAIRSRHAERRRAGVRELVRDERFASLLLAIGLEPSVQQRQVLAAHALEHSAGQHHFLTPGNLLALAQSIDPNAATPESLITDRVIDVSATHGQLNRLLDYLDSIPRRRRQSVLVLIAKRASAVDRLCRSLDAADLFGFMHRAADPSQVADALASEPATLRPIARAAVLGRLLDQVSDEQETLNRWLGDRRPIISILNHAVEDELADLFSRMHLDLQRMDAVRSVHAVSCSEPRLQERAIARFERVLKADDLLWKTYLVERVHRLAVTNRPAAEIRTLFTQLMAARSPLESLELMRLTVQNAAPHLTEKEAFDWYTGHLDRLSEQEQMPILQTLSKSASFLAAAGQRQAEATYALIDRAIRMKDAKARRLATGFILSLPPAHQRDRDGQPGEHTGGDDRYERLVKIGNACPEPSAGEAITLGISAHSELVASLVREGHFGNYEQRVDGLPDRGSRIDCWTRLLPCQGVADELANRDRWSVLTAYRDVTLSRAQRQKLLSVMLHPACLSLLLQHGEFSQISDTIDRAPTTVRTQLATRFLTNSDVLAFFEERDQLDRVKAFLRRVPSTEIAEVLIRFASAPMTDVVREAVVDTIWRRVDDVPQVDNLMRAKIYRALLRNPQNVQRMIARGESDQLLPMLQRTLAPSQFGAVLTEFLNSPASSDWLEAVGVESLLHASFEYLADQPRYLGDLLNASNLIRHAESSGSLDVLLARLDQLSSLSRRSVTQRFSPVLTAALIRQGRHRELMALATSDPTDVSLPALSQLLQSNDYRRKFLQNESASKLLEIAWRQQSRTDMLSIVRLVLAHPDCVWDLIDREHWLPLLQKLNGLPEASDRQQCLSSVLASPAALTALSDRQVIATYRILAEGSAEGEVSLPLRQLLRSSPAVHRLCVLGQRDALMDLVKGDDRARLQLLHHGHVVDALDESQRRDAVAWLRRRLVTGKVRLYQCSQGALIATYLEQRGVTSLLEVLPDRDLAALSGLCSNRRAVLSLIERGELAEVWRRLDQQARLMASSSMLKTFRSREAADALMSGNAALAIADWLEMLSEREVKNAFFFSAYGVEAAFFRHGLGHRHERLARRRMSSRGSRLSDSMFSRRSRLHAIGQGKIEDVARELRADSEGWENTMRLVAFLVAAGLADREIADLSAAPAPNPDEDHRLVALLKARGHPDRAAAEAASLGLDSLATVIAIEQHRWRDATTMSLPTASSLPGGPADSDPAITAIESVALRGRLASYGGAPEVFVQAVRDLEQSLRNHSGKHIPAERAAVDSLILLERGRPNFQTLRKHPWREFYLRRETGFYGPAIARLGFHADKPGDYYRAIAGETSPDDPRRRRAVSFMLDLAATLRQIGRRDDARQIDVVLGDYGRQLLGDAASSSDAAKQKDAKDYVSRLLGQWIRQRNSQPCEDLLAEHPTIDPIAVANQAFRGLGPRAGIAYEINRFLQRRGPLLTLTQRLTMVLEIMDDPIGSEAGRELIQLAGRELADAIQDPNCDLALFEAVARLWMDGQAESETPLDEVLVLLERSDDFETWRDYAVDRFRRGEHAEAARAFEEAAKLTPIRGDLLYLRGEALMRSATHPEQRRRGETLRRAGHCLSFDPRHRILLAELLESAGLAEQSVSQWRLVRNTTLPGSSNYLLATRRLGDLADDTLERQQLRRELLIALCRINADRGEPAELLCDAQSVRRAAMEHALAQRDFASLSKQWQASRVINPNDSDWMKDVIPRVDAAGGKSLANEMFAATRRFLDSRVKVFDQSADFLLRRASLSIAAGRLREAARRDLAAASRLPATGDDRLRDVAATTRRRSR